MEHLVRFSVVPRFIGGRLEASWERRRSILETAWVVGKEFFLVLDTILQLWFILDYFSFMYEATLDSFFTER